MSAPVTWGVVSTIKAPVNEVLNFCAHHLELGAHRLFIYLDDDNQEAFRILSDHPKVRPVLTDDSYWQKRGMKRRVKHQARQFENAKQAYNRSKDLDWLAHIDVDEFLWPQTPVAEQLAALPADCLCARMRPWEALSGDGPETCFKGFSLAQPKRRRQTEEIYPEFGQYLNGGFLSHVAGKMFYRTGVQGLKVQIHNVFVQEEMNPGQVELNGIRLLHMHAKSWESFRDAFHFRLERGSYRSELRPNKPREDGGRSLHELFSEIFQAQGEGGLRGFYQSVCVAESALLSRLDRQGLLLRATMDLDQKRQKHFPGTL